MTKAKKSCALCGSIYHTSQNCSELKQAPLSLKEVQEEMFAEWLQQNYFLSLLDRR